MNKSPIERLRAIIARLRAPGGCPWDREQTHASLAPSLLEEAYEAVDAITRDDEPNLREELGDLLLHVVLHAQIARERGAFDFDAVAAGVADKMVRRHPHVFGDDRLTDSGSVISRWEEIKRQEKATAAQASGAGSDAPTEPSWLDGLLAAQPALMRAQKAQEKASRVGFDWPAANQVLDKVREEIGEVVEAADALSAAEEAGASAGSSEGARAAVAEEIGDLLFAAVNLARWHQLDAEMTLQHATDKFVRRFKRIEAALRARGQAWSAATPAELDALWEEAKRRE